MGKLLKAILIIAMLLPICLSAGDRVKLHWMADSVGAEPRYPTWVEIDSASSRSVWFYFTPNRKSGDSLQNVIRDDLMTTIDHSGFATVVVWFDSSSTVGANLDTVDVTGTLLFWDKVNDAYSEPVVSYAGGDSANTANIATDLKYRASHADGKYSIAYTWNFKAGAAGIKLTFGTNTLTNAYMARAELYLSESP